MKIDQRTKLSDIQNAFNKQYTHLRLEFYKKPHEAGEGSADREKLNHDKTLGEVTKSLQVRDLHFNDHMQIKDFEALLDIDLGLHAQVFRRSGSVWLQTTATDAWTLDQANRKGRHSEVLSKDLTEEQPEPPGQETE